MRIYWRIVAIVIIMNGISGCASYGVVPEPGKITLQAAMKEVATGLNEMYAIRKDHPKSGLLPAEVTVVFNISAKANDEGKLYVEAGATPADVLKIAKIGAEAASKIEASRGNTVTIKFTNILFAPKETLVMTKSPEDIAKLLGITVLEATLDPSKGTGIETLTK